MSCLKKLTSLLKEKDEVIAHKYPVIERGSDLYLIQIKRINDTERDKTIVLYDGPNKSTYVVDGIMGIDDFTNQDVHGIYNQLSHMKSEARRFVMSHGNNHSPDEDRCERITNQILNPNIENLVTNQDNDAVDMIVLHLMELNGSNDDLLKKLFDKSIYPRAAHKFNKLLESDNQYTYDKYLSTNSYAEFLDILKDKKFNNYGMHANYIKQVLAGKSLMPKNDFKELIAKKRGNGDIKEAISTIRNTDKNDYRDWAKGINDSPGGFYIFEATTYCLDYIHSGVFDQ